MHVRASQAAGASVHIRSLHFWYCLAVHAQWAISALVAQLHLLHYSKKKQWVDGQHFANILCQTWVDSLLSVQTRRQPMK